MTISYLNNLEVISYQVDFVVYVVGKIISIHSGADDKLEFLASWDKYIQQCDICFHMIVYVQHRKHHLEHSKMAECIYQKHKVMFN